eukprot:gnl/Chilomastix_cuspidata/2637.p1 GENE.gnl/Chilomastix_cuspidata/2637~~gnl/Chilomastix_cuspidata/2637.p1  ORF type:complete len:981 (-),score=487.38 gnl/Chilomastix_cuspidata/2637:713-3655(-)
MEGSSFQRGAVVGVVAAPTPVAVEARSKDFFAMVSTGRRFNIYNLDKLTISMMGPQVPHKITAMAMHQHTNVVAAKRKLHLFQRREPLAELSVLPAPTDLLVTISRTLLAFSRDGSLTLVDLKDAQHLKTYRLPFAAADGAPEVTAALHPTSYVNKIVVGTRGGELELHNFNTEACIFTFPGLHRTIAALVAEEARRVQPLAAALEDSSESDAPLEAPALPAVTALAQSPVVDVVAVAYASGHCVVHNLRTDRTIASFYDAGAAICSASFRQERGATPILVLGNERGQMSVWDLEKKNLRGLVSGAHAPSTRVVSLAFLPGEALLLSLGGDNSLRLWVFDQPNGMPRLLKERCGPASPPQIATFLGAATQRQIVGNDKNCILALGRQARQMRARATGAAKDSTRSQLWALSTVKQEQNKMFSAQGEHIPRGQPLSLSCSELYSGSFPDVATVFEGSKQLLLWSSFHRRRAVRPIPDPLLGAGKRLRREDRAAIKNLQKADGRKAAKAADKIARRDLFNLRSPDRSAFTRCAISADGRTLLGGTEKGNVLVVSVQSGARVFKKMTKVTSPVELIDTNAFSTHGFTLHTDGSMFLFALGTWDNATARVRLAASAHVSASYHARSHGFLCVGWSDCTIQIFSVARMFEDGEMRAPTLVRTITGMTAPATPNCLAFTPDARYLVVSCREEAVRVFDVPTVRQVDTLALKRVPSSLSLLFDGKLLALTLTDTPGVHVWEFTPGCAASDEEPQEGADAAFEALDQPPVGDERAQFPILSGLPPTRWAALAALDEEREKTRAQLIELDGYLNQAQAERVPFFLAVKPGAAPELDTSAFEEELAESRRALEDAPTVLERARGKLGTSEQQKALAAHRDGALGAQELLTAWKQLGPAATDLEIGLLPADLLPAWLAFLAALLEANRELDYVQGLLACTLRKHATVLRTEPAAREALSRLLAAQAAAGATFELSLNRCVSGLRWLLGQQG